MFGYSLVVGNAPCISLKLCILVAFYNAKYLLHSFMDLHRFGKMRYVSVPIFFFFVFQNQVCLNVDGYNSTESITLDQWLQGGWGVMSHPPPGHLVMSRDISDCHECMEGDCYWLLPTKASDVTKHLMVDRKASPKSYLLQNGNDAWGWEMLY